MDYKTTPKWALPGSRDQISIIWDPLITLEQKELSASNLVQTEYGASLHMDHKTTPKFAWPVSRDPILQFWDPLVTFERKELSASNLVQT